jgi:hypothetical protein
MTVLGGEINLPAEGTWQVIQPEPSSPLHNVYLIPPPEKQAEKRSQIMARAEREKYLEDIGRWQTQRWYLPIQQFARNNNGIGPVSWAALFKDSQDHPYLQDLLE